MPVRPGDVLVGCQSGMKAFSSFSVCDVKADRHPCVAAAMQSRANPQKIGFPRHAGRFARELFSVALMSAVACYCQWHGSQRLLNPRSWMRN